MSVDQRLALQTNQSLDTASPITAANREQLSNTKATEDILKSHYEGLDAREKSRLSSTIAGAAQLKGFLDQNDLEGAHDFLVRRRQQLHARIGSGENIDTQETDAALEMIRSGKIDELKNGIHGLMAAGQVYGILASSDSPSNVREWQYYNSLSPEQKAEYLTMKRANPAIDLGGQTIIPNPANPAGAPNAVFQETLSPADQPENAGAKAGAVMSAQKTEEKMANKSKAQNALASYETQVGLVNNAIVDAEEAIKSGAATGWANMALGALPDTQARRLNNALETIKANLGFDKIQAMRDASPTGGALGAPSDFEQRLLQAVNGSLDPKQADQLQKNLATIKELYPKLLQEKKAAFARDYGGAGTSNTGMNDDQPPIEGAKKAPDGKWYVRQGAGWARVDQ